MKMKLGTVLREAEEKDYDISKDRVSKSSNPGSDSNRPPPRKKRLNFDAIKLKRMGGVYTDKADFAQFNPEVLPDWYVVAKGVGMEDYESRLKKYDGGKRFLKSIPKYLVKYKNTIEDKDTWLAGLRLLAVRNMKDNETRVILYQRFWPQGNSTASGSNMSDE